MKLFNIAKNLTDYKGSNEPVRSSRGRDYITDKNFPGGYMLGLAFGGRDTPATKRLAINAEDCRDIFDRPSMPLVSQWAILVNMPRVLEDDYSIDSKLKGVAGEEVALNTREAMEIAREHIISEYGRNALREAVYIAHPAHMQRVIWLGEKLDFKGVPLVDRTIVWNEDLTDGTSSPKAWKKQELIKRVHHLLNRWI